MAQSIPLSLFNQITPAVIAGAGTALGMNSVFLTSDKSIPIGAVQEFGNAAAVSAWFGPTAPESVLAGYYFAGITTGAQLPSALYFAQYNTAAVGAYLRGAPLALTLTQLQALAGTITVEVDGQVITTPNINLASATSFSAAAALIQTGLQAQGAVCTATAGITASSTSLVVSGVTSGQLYIGATITDASGDIPAGTTIVSGPAGGGAGTYVMSQPATATVASDTVYISSQATCTYDSLRKAFVISSPTTGTASTIAYPTDTSLSPALLLTQAAGAVVSPGAAAATPAALMQSIVGQSQDWATFMTVFDPDNGAPGGPIKQEFSTWTSQQNGQYAYVAWDTDPTPGTTLPDPNCFAQQVASLSGTIPVWDQTATQAAAVAAVVCAWPACINFNAANGNTTLKFRASPALAPTLTDETIFLNVTGTPSNPGNGYNTYAAVASRTTSFQWIQLGTITGSFKTAEAYINQMYWAAVFQNDLAVFETNMSNIPYNQSGYGGVRQALAGDIQAMGSFGAYQANVTLSTQEQQAANADAGLTIAPTLQTQGWYLLVADPGAAVRAAGGSPICKFYYVYGGSVGQINMTSTVLQ